MLTRMMAFLVILVVFSATFQAGSMSDVSQTEADLFMSEFEELVEGIDAFGIFVHNTLIALPMFIPGAGIAWGLVSAWSTGYAFAAITATMPELEAVPALAVFVTPFGLMEVAAYSLAMSRSLLVAAAIIKKKGLSDHLWPALIEAGIVVALLLTGGYVEFYMMEQVLAADRGTTTPPNI